MTRDEFNEKLDGWCDFWEVPFAMKRVIMEKWDPEIDWENWFSKVQYDGEGLRLL